MKKTITMTIFTAALLLPLGLCSALDQGSKQAIVKTIGGYICQGDTSWVSCTDKATQGCPALAEAVLDTCLRSYEADIQKLSKPEETAALSVNLTLCVHKQVKAHYQSESEACSTLPPHLSK